MSDLIRDALKKLDPSNANHWTGDKLPRLETVKLMAGDQSVTREQVDTAAPGFTKDTAVGYWLTAPEPAAQAAAGPAGATEQQGQGDSGSPHPAGAGAGPQAETQTGEGAEASQAPDGASGGGADAQGASEQLEVEGLGDLGEPDELATLEAQLEAAQDAITQRRGLIDDLKKEIDEIAGIETQIYDRIQKLKGKDKPLTSAIQSYLARQRTILEERAARKQLIKDSGIDLKLLADNLKAPIDAARARRRTR